MIEMSVEGLRKLADELYGSTNPPFKAFGERLKEELEGVQDVPPVEPIEMPEDVVREAEARQDAEAEAEVPPAPEDRGWEEPPTPEPTVLPEREAGETDDQFNARAFGMDPH